MVKRKIGWGEFLVRLLTLIFVLIIYPFVHIYSCIRAGMYGFKVFFLNEWDEGFLIQFLTIFVKRVSRSIFKK